MRCLVSLLIGVMNRMEIIEIPNFLTLAECQEFVQMSENKGYEQAKVNLGSQQKVMPGIRNNQRYMHLDQPLANMLWDRLKQYAPKTIGNSTAIGLNELFRFYRYTKDQRFKRHRDGSYIRNETEASYYTFMVYLNDEYEGGSTTFKDREVKPQTGKGLIFLHDLWHEGTAVTSGKKYVLRSDIMYQINE